MHVACRSFLKGMEPLAARAAASGGLAAFPSVGSAKNSRCTPEEIVKPSCAHCVNFYRIEVHKAANINHSILPNPDRREYFNHGISSKGGAGGFTAYNPYQGKVPLKRIKSEKGLNVDLKWVGISWREA